MNVLIACEESQRVCMAFRERGFTAFSADIQECSGGHPEWYIHGDVLPILNGNCEFVTQNGDKHIIDGKWDLCICHPPCTDLALSGARHFEKKRADGRQREAIEFFMKFIDADCPHICVENPMNIMSGEEYIKTWFPDLWEKYPLPLKNYQVVSPHYFGSTTRKKTCYWLKELPALRPTNIVKPRLRTYIGKNGKKITFSEDFCIGAGSHSGKQRSKTAPEIAEAMADQWGTWVNNLLEKQKGNKK